MSCARKAARPKVARPGLGWFLLLDGGIALLTVLTVSESAHTAVSEKIPVPPRNRLRQLLIGTLIVHIGEAKWAFWSARRKGLPATRWGLQTLVVGFPSLRKLAEQPSAD